MRAAVVLVLAAALAVTAACDSASAPEGAPKDSVSTPESTPTTDAKPPRGDCPAWWNSPGNEANRNRLVESSYRVGGISQWHNSGGVAGPRGCDYVFHDYASYVSFRGYWKRKRFWWERGFETGPWTTEMATIPYYRAYLVAHDGTIRLDPDWEASAEEES